MIIFLGVAGSGKSTQCRLLSKTLDYNYISVGELLRKSSDKLINEKINAGDMLGDDVVISAVEDAITNIPIGREFIIDGFPRTLGQAKWIASKQNVGLIRVVNIKISLPEIVRRLKLRARSDDNNEAINRRINEYSSSINSILEEFISNNIDVFSIDGSLNIEEVHEQIKSYIIGNKKVEG
ncbi:MAG TPA: nucleoside monophosphate kinase [Candidatus Dormibacteraeota bacterium]|nr:nucleoside monophosphate kinase [Candidatus Dormibacteraeota bacterium]